MSEPFAERVGREVHDRLALEEQQREVVRGHVRERDRDERVHELLRQAAGAEAAAHALRPADPEPVEARDEQDGPDQPEQEGQLERVLGREPEVLEELGDVGRDAVPGPLLVKPSNETEPIITATSATVPGSCSSRGRPESGLRRPTSRSRVSNTATCARTG